MPATACSYWWDDLTTLGLSVVTAATEEPVSLAAAKRQSRVDQNSEDLWFAAAIASARRLAETFLKRRFVSTTLRLTIDQLPAWEFYLPSPPLVSVTSVKYYDSTNTQQTISASLYTVDTYTQPGRITPAYNQSWPTGISHTNAVEVVYVAGYGAASAVPASIKQAILMTVEHMWSNRGDGDGATNIDQIPAVAKALLRAESWGYLP